MDWSAKIHKALRRRRLQLLLRGAEPSAKRVSEAADAVIEHVKRDERDGVRGDRILFGFESEYEMISDGILRLRDGGEMAAYRDICGKLYAFASERMKDSYMPLYLSIIYRYADALMETDEPEEALRLFEELYTRTDRLIGIDNPYGIRCLERMAEAAVRCGQTARAETAIKEMAVIAKEEFGPYSAMMMAVRHFAARLTGKEKPAAAYTGAE